MENMKAEKFKELTDDLTDKEFRELSPFIRRNCSECQFLHGRISLWCTNEQAVKMRGTSIPAISNCPFWKPDWEFIDTKHQTKKNGYIEEQTGNLQVESFRKRLLKWPIFFKK